MITRKAKTVILDARQRAGISQRELARRLGTHQPVVARWETGKTQPDYSIVVRAVQACGFQLEARLVPINDHDLVLIRRETALLPHQRLSSMVTAVNRFSEMASASA